MDWHRNEHSDGGRLESEFNGLLGFEIDGALDEPSLED